MAGDAGCIPAGSAVGPGGRTIGARLRGPGHPDRAVGRGRTGLDWVGPGRVVRGRCGFLPSFEVAPGDHPTPFTGRSELATKDRYGESNCGGHAPDGGSVQLDGHPVSLGETADDHEPKGSAHIQPHDRRPGQQLVGLGHGLRAHPDAPVGNRDDVLAARTETALRLHRRARRRELGGVFHQLGQEVGHVDGDGGVDRHLIKGADPDTAVVGHLAHRHPHHVGHGYRSTPAAGGIGPSQHQQALSITAHPGSQVVKAKEVLELVRITLVGFELVDELDLAVEQGLVAASQVHENIADSLPQQGALLLGDLHGHPLQVVEGGRQLTQLVPRFQIDGLRLEGDVPRAGLQLRHQRRELLGRDAVGRLGQAAKRSGDGPRHQIGQGDRGQNAQTGPGQVQPSRSIGRGAFLPGLTGDVALDIIRQGQQVTEASHRGGGQVGSVNGLARQDLCLERFGGAGLGASQGVAQQGPELRIGLFEELVEVTFGIAFGVLQLANLGASFGLVRRGVEGQSQGVGPSHRILGPRQGEDEAQILGEVAHDLGTRGRRQQADKALGGEAVAEQDALHGGLAGRDRGPQRVHLG